MNKEKLNRYLNGKVKMNQKNGDVTLSNSDYWSLVDKAEKLQMIENEWRNGTGQSIDEALSEAFG